MTTERGWHKDVIQSAYLEKRATRLARFRSFFHRLMPGVVRPPIDREYLRTADGRSIPIGARIKSAEGVRYYGSSLPLPQLPKLDQPEHDDFHDPLAVEIGLGVSAHDIPADGWPDEVKPDVIRRILGYMREE